MSSAPSPTFLTPRQTADELQISERTLHTLTKAGEIPSIRLGKRVIRYSREVILGLASKPVAASNGDGHENGACLNGHTQV